MCLCVCVCVCHHVRVYHCMFVRYQNAQVSHEGSKVLYMQIHARGTHHHLHLFGEDGCIYVLCA